MGQIFLSHTKQDKDFCDYFDSICARVGIQAFRSEFETIEPPAWATIRVNVKRKPTHCAGLKTTHLFKAKPEL